MAKRKPLSEQDVALFRSAAGAVRPLAAGEKVALRPISGHTSEAPRARRRLARSADAKSEPQASRAGGEAQLFTRPGMQPKLLRRLRQGRVPVTAEIDLHGMTVREARRALTGFIDACYARGERCVRVIHGRGQGSQEGQAVIKWEVDGWLRARPEVLAFCSTPPWDGGAGAVYVYLRATRGLR